MERKRAPVAQLDRALASGARGRGFESRRVRHFFVRMLNTKIKKKRNKKLLQIKFAPLMFFFFLSGQ